MTTAFEAQRDALIARNRQQLIDSGLGEAVQSIRRLNDAEKPSVNAARPKPPTAPPREKRDRKAKTKAPAVQAAAGREDTVDHGPCIDDFLYCPSSSSAATTDDEGDGMGKQLSKRDQKALEIKGEATTKSHRQWIQVLAPTFR